MRHKNLLLLLFRKKKFPDFRVPQAKISRTPKFGFPYMERTHNKIILLRAPVVSSKQSITPESSFFQVPSQQMMNQNY